MGLLGLPQVSQVALGRLLSLPLLLPFSREELDSCSLRSLNLLSALTLVLTMTRLAPPRLLPVWTHTLLGAPSCPSRHSLVSRTLLSSPPSPESEKKQALRETDCHRDTPGPGYVPGRAGSFLVLWVCGRRLGVLPKKPMLSPQLRFSGVLLLAVRGSHARSSIFALPRRLPPAPVSSPLGRELLAGTDGISYVFAPPARSTV